MKVHKVTMYVVDHDELGPDEVRNVLENTRYPNHCMSPRVLEISTRDAGLWSDEHPLNNTKLAPGEIARLFA